MIPAPHTGWLVFIIGFLLGWIMRYRLTLEQQRQNKSHRQNKWKHGRDHN